MFFKKLLLALCAASTLLAPKAHAFKQIESINQTTYENSNEIYKPDIIEHEVNLCGTFACYNAEMMMGYTETSEAQRPMTNYAAFGLWLNRHLETFQKIKNYLGRIGSLKLDDINQILEQSVDKNYTLVLQASWLEGNNLITQIDEYKKLYDATKAFKENKQQPWAIIINFVASDIQASGHWIALKVTEHETFVADSLAIDRTNDPVIKTINTWFRRNMLPKPQDIQSLVTQLAKNKNNPTGYSKAVNESTLPEYFKQIAQASKPLSLTAEKTIELFSDSEEEVENNTPKRKREEKQLTSNKRHKNNSNNAQNEIIVLE